MRMQPGSQLVTTIGERCRVCYTCVRDCPAKAIRIAGGQAQVVPERCIGCGNCYRVCSQKAKQVYDSRNDVRALLVSGRAVAAIVAPSYPAEFSDLEPSQVAGMIRRLGFHLVCETAFGADLVAQEYRRLLETDRGGRYIGTTCPAVVAYVQKYLPELVPNLAPIVSPMIAEARALRRIHGDELAVVFIGPCLAKKVEADGIGAHTREVEAVLTFIELRAMLREAGIEPRPASEERDFDPPHPTLGALFPISRGLLQAAHLREDLLEGTIVAADGRPAFLQALSDFAAGALDVRLLEVLCCNGCVMGAGMSVDAPLFQRRMAVSRHARRRVERSDPATEELIRQRLAGLDLHAEFRPEKLPSSAVPPEELKRILAVMGKLSPEDELNCGACGYSTCREHAAAIYLGLAESEMCLPYTIDRLRESLKELSESNAQLASAREALMNAEKLASMGQLAAGIAHEINNPLGVILLYAKMLLDEIPPASEARQDLALIAEQAERCRNIVSGLLNFARRNRVIRRPTNLIELVERCRRGVVIPDHVYVYVRHNMRDPVAEVDGDQILQVLTNLIVNAVEAMPNGGELTIETDDTDLEVILRVRDTGCGIPPQNLPKIFEPFFTTKQIGKGTGLGLAVAYGIVKMHRGRIEVTSNADPSRGPTGTTFTVTLPRRAEEV
jgi:signal transduction histidine kinase/Fe-S-cluster-containing hydrogenase component 2